MGRWWLADGSVVAGRPGAIAAVQFGRTHVEANPMRHNHHNSQQPAIADRSPLEALEAAFATLSRGIRPVTLPCALVNGQPAAGQVTVEEVRSRLVHPSCSPEQRDRVWSEV